MGRLNLQTPLDHLHLENLAQKQLDLHPVPRGYVKQLRHHLQVFPHDDLFHLVPHQGTGYGIIKCLEPGCSSTPIVLRPRTSQPDGGKSIGVGGLAEFQSHILEDELHETLRDRRIHRQKHNLRSSSTHPSPVSSTPSSTVNRTHVDGIKRSPVASTVQTPSNLQARKFRTGIPNPNTPNQEHMSSTLAPAPLDFDSMPPTHQKNHTTRFVDLDCSDSDILIIPDKLNSHKTNIPTPSPDDDEALVWVDEQCLIPPRLYSKLGKSSPVSDTSNSTLHPNSLRKRPAPQSESATRSKFHDSLSPHKRKSIVHFSAIHDDQNLPDTQSKLSEPIPMEIDPPIDLFNLDKYRGIASLDPWKFSASTLPISQTQHIDPSLTTCRFSSLSPLMTPQIMKESTPTRTAPKVKRESTLIRPDPKIKQGSTPLHSTAIGSPATSSLPGSSKLHDAQNTPSSSKLFDLQNIPESHQLIDFKPYMRPFQSPFDTRGTRPLNKPLEPLNLLKHLTPLAQTLHTPSIPRSISPHEPPEMRHDELQEFYKRAVEGIKFSHHATVTQARKALGISEDEDARMEGLSVMLMPHQLIGVSWMLQREANANCGGILADDMGLGKTVQTIATIVKNRSTHPKIKSTLVLAPLALLTQWREEIHDKSTCDLKVLIYHQSFSKPTKKKKIANYDIVITTLDTLSNDWDDDKNVTTSKRLRGLFKIEWYRVVVDEAQTIRNPGTKKSRAVCALKTTYRWCLTGTPIFNGLMDIFPYLRFLHIRPYNDIGEFRHHITRYEKTNPNLATKRAQAVLATCMLRRQKDSKLNGQLLIVLPSKTIEDIMLDFTPDERDIYEMLEKQAQRKFNAFLRRGTVLKNFACILVLLLRLRQACGHPSLAIEEADPDAGAEFDSSFTSCYLDPCSEHKRALTNLGQEWVDHTKRKILEEVAELVKIEKEDPSQAAALECPICGDPLEDTARITTCGHVFCQACIEILFTPTEPMVADGSQAAIDPIVVQEPCPSCRHPFRQCDTYLKRAFLPSEDDDDSDGELPGYVYLARRKKQHQVVEDSDEDEPPPSKAKTTPPSKAKTTPPITAHTQLVPSTKLVWMLEEIIRIKQDSQADKTIIISQWTGMLSMCGTYLREHGCRFVHYQGDMTGQERDEAVHKFKRNSNVSIMLMSLKCGGVGLNLTCANRVISLDLAWSPASERQAFDRTHRLGQVKNVMIKRVMIQNSVEQRICNLQRQKQDLSDNVLGEGTGKKLKQLTVNELANLFNLNVHGETLS